MFTKIRQYKKMLFVSLGIFIIASVYLYQISRPIIIFHTYKESGYLGKVSTFDGCIDKLYIKNHIAQYRLPHIWNWNKEDEIAIFTRNHNDLLKKEDIDFWKLDVFLDENGYYVSHSKTGYFGQSFAEVNN